MDAILILAPLRGVTGLAFRRAYVRWFGGLDGAVAPFLTTVRGNRIKRTHLREILPELNTALPLVPQVIGKSPAEMRTLLLAIRELGYTRADLNAGCPWPFVVRKGRGAGLLKDEAALAAMLEAGCDVMPGGFSIKVRLGLDTPDLLQERMAVLNRFPLREVTIHARTARQMYGGHVNLVAFATSLGCCRHRVVYNGDIRAPADLQRLQGLYPTVSGWMIGRGLVADPFLAERIRDPAMPRDLARLRGFVSDFTALSQEELSGPASLLGRLKEFWSYLSQSFANGDRLWKAIRVCRRLEEYQAVVDSFFSRDAVWKAEPPFLQPGPDNRRPTTSD